MKNFKVLLQNACEDYLTSLSHEPTLVDVAQMCQIDISEVVWKAFALASENRKLKAQPDDPVINGLRQSEVKTRLTRFAKLLLGKPIGENINTLKYMFNICKRYCFKFCYGTSEGLFEDLKHDEDNKELIRAFSIIKK